MSLFGDHHIHKKFNGKDFTYSYRLSITSCVGFLLAILSKRQSRTLFRVRERDTIDNLIYNSAYFEGNTKDISFIKLQKTVISITKKSGLTRYLSCCYVID